MNPTYFPDFERQSEKPVYGYPEDQIVKITQPSLLHADNLTQIYGARSYDSSASIESASTCATFSSSGWNVENGEAAVPATWESANCALTPDFGSQIMRTESPCNNYHDERVTLQVKIPTKHAKSYLGEDVFPPSDSTDEAWSRLFPSTERRLPPAMGFVLGKYGPYSPQNNNSDGSSSFGTETELGSDDEDDVGITPSPSPSVSGLAEICEPKHKLVVDVLHAFWNCYNKNCQAITTACITSLFREATNGTTSSTTSNSANSGSSIPSTTTNSSNVPKSTGTKRKFSEDDLPSDGDGEPRNPARGAWLSPGEPRNLRYACPFRKHNPRKYNMHHHQRCALGYFTSIARIKEHLYRRHMAPTQCVRCWLFFKDQDHLNIHISAAKVCERRDGQLTEGITPSLEKKLRSRKKASADQTDEDRWRDIYRLLFPAVPDEEIPSPFYETVQDDVAQASELPDIPIEEFMRQEVPQIFISHLQTEVNNMNLEETGLLKHPALLRNIFIARMTTLINEAQDAAVEAYRQTARENSSQPSPNEPSCPAPWQRSRSASQPSNELDLPPPSKRQLNLNASSCSETSKSIDHVDSESNHDSLEGYKTNFQGYITDQIGQEADRQSMNTGLNLTFPELWMEFNPEMENWDLGQELNPGGEWSEVNEEWTATETAQ